MLRNVTKAYRGTAAVSGLSFAVPPGQVFGLLGPNGAGKTTTLGMICGLIPPTSGDVEIFGMSTSPAGTRWWRRGKRARQIHRAVGFVPQETALYPELTVAANMRFHAGTYGVPRRGRDQKIADLLELVSLGDRARSRAGTLSGGQQRRLAIARALLHGPQLLILDEPTIGVDPQGKEAIWEHITRICTQGKTVLVTTNQLEETVHCDLVVIIDHGTRRAFGTPAALQEAHGGTVITARVTITADDLSAALGGLRAHPGVQEATAKPLLRQDHGGAWECQLDVTARGGCNITGAVTTIVPQWGVIQELAVHEPTLSDVFLDLTGRALRE